jgi:hypothetical protein
MVDELGGIEVAFPYPARDSNSGLDVDAGNQVLDGRMALAYARSRHYQENQGGEWVSVDANDIGRTARQQEVIRAIMGKLKSPSSIADAGEIAGAVARHMTIDSHLAEASVAAMAWQYKGILTGSVEGATLPTEGRTIDGASVLVIKEPDAAAMLANFRAGRALAEQPIRLQVLNGNGVGGAATSMSETLEGEGYMVADIGDAESSDYAQTTVIVPEGSADGQTIVNSIGFGVVQVGQVGTGFDAVVIVGSDAS